MARAGAKRSTRKLKIGRSLGVNLWGQAKSRQNPHLTSVNTNRASMDQHPVVVIRLITQNRCAQNRR